MQEILQLYSTCYLMLYICFSPDGEMLCSQGGSPDYLLTVWKWKASKIILQSQSFINDVYKSTFSQLVPGHITTCGMNMSLRL
jgi:hypothetical protein